MGGEEPGQGRDAGGRHGFDGCGIVERGRTEGRSADGEDVAVLRIRHCFQGVTRIDGAGEAVGTGNGDDVRDRLDVEPGRQSRHDILAQGRGRGHHVTIADC